MTIPNSATENKLRSGKKALKNRADFERPSNKPRCERDDKRATAAKSTRPAPIKPQFNRIPAELRERNQWVVWRYVRKGDKWTKIPFNAETEDYASTTDTQTWTSFKRAKAAFLRGDYDGIGYVFSKDDPYAGADFDHCFEVIDGKKDIKPDAKYWVEVLDSYTERSVSGDGLHVIIKAKPSECFNNTPEGRELYGHARYFTFTGESYHDEPKPIAEREGEVEVFINKYSPKKRDAETQMREYREGEERVKKLAREAQEWYDEQKRLWREEWGGLSPFEAFQLDGDITPLLREIGATPAPDCGAGEQWQHPKSHNPGSIVVFSDTGLVHVRTHRWEPMLEQGKTYSKGGFYSAVKHGGDCKAAYRDLLAQGFGEKPKNNGNGFDSSSRFYVNDEGVYLKDGEKDKWISSPLWVKAYANDENKENAGLRLEWRDRHGDVRQWTMPRELLAGDSAEIQRELMRREFVKVATGRGANDLFLDYLRSANPEKDVRNTSRIGWSNGAYVLPDETIGAPNGEETVLQSNVNDYRLAVKGSIEDWQTNVGKYCEGNSRLLFAASVAFAAPLLRPLGQEGGGFHFRGQSSQGKSTATIVAGSIYGGGDSILGFARTWANTANALEATAEMHNDGLLILDELARCDAKDAGNVAYMLASGDGKGRLRSDIKMRKPFKWQLMFLSTGEISLHDHAATAGKKTRAGQEVRLVDLPADTNVYGVFENLHGFDDGSKFAQALQRNARSYYGAPLRAYLAKLTQDDLSDIKQKFLEFERQFTDLASNAAEEIGQQVSGEVLRVAGRFALVAFAGDLATAYGVTGWTKDAALVAAFDMFKEWIENRGGTGNADEEKMVSQVRKFLAENDPNRFEYGYAEERISGKRAGFVIEGEIEGEKEFCIFADVFKAEVCAGHDLKDVAKALHSRGHLVKGDDGKNSLVRRVPSDKTAHRVYVIKQTIFET